MATRTPRRTAVKRTPYKISTAESKEIDNTTGNTNILDIIKYYKEKELIRENYITALKEENEYLKKSTNSIDYSLLTGLHVYKIGDQLECIQKIEKEKKVSLLSFTLQENNEGFTYKYKNSKNITELPEYLKKEIYFDKDQVKLFFFNVYECVAKE